MRRVTIVTPSLNQGDFITHAIESVLTQDHPAIEYIVVDGGSTDETVEILRRYDGRFRWWSEPDGGQAAAIVAGFAQARGDVLGWLNADDLYTPGAVSRAVAHFDAHPDEALIYGHAEFIDATGHVLGPCRHVEPFDSHRLLHTHDFIVQPTTFFTREAFVVAGGLHPTLKYCLDYDLWLRMARQRKPHCLPDGQARVRVLSRSKTSRGGVARIDELERVMLRYGRSRVPAYFYRPAFNVYGKTALDSFAKGQLSQAIRHARRAVFYAVAEA